MPLTMKSIITCIALLLVGLLYYSTKIDEAEAVQIQAAVLDSCGDQIWPIDHTVPCDGCKTYSALIENGSLTNIEISDNHLYESYLISQDANTLRIWSPLGITDLPISQYVSTAKTKPVAKQKQTQTGPITSETKREKYSQADKATVAAGRDAYRLMQRGGHYDPTVALSAHHTVQKLIDKKNKEAQQRDAGLRRWSSIGPGNVGGRVRAIAPHPTNNSELIIGTASGGIWKTTNGGSTWSNVSDFLPNMSVSDIAYNPDNPDIVYATTSEPFNGAGFGGGTLGNGAMSVGVGLLMSTNGGDTWTVTTPDNGDFIWVSAVAVDPDDPENVYITTVNTQNQNTVNNTSGLVYKSEDSGENWTLLQAVSGRPYDIEISPANPDIVIIGTSIRAYRSTNATGSINSISFSNISDEADELPNGGRIEIDWSESISTTVYASVDRNSGEVWRSTNSGATWTKRNTTNFGYLNNQGWYDNTIWVDPTNSSRIVVGGIDLWRSTNGGQTFTKISDWFDDINETSNNQGTSVHADQHVIVEAIDYSSTNRLVYIGNDGGVYSTNNITSVSQNSGWNDLNNNLRITQFYGGAVSPDRTFVVGGAQDNSFIVDAAFGGTYWRVPVTGDGAFAAINYNDDDIAYANVNNNSIFKTSDGGSTWSRITRFGGNNVPAGCSVAVGCISSGTFNVPDGASLISKFIIDPNNPDVLIAGARRLWRNNDAGDPNDWSVIRSSNGSQFVAMAVGSTSSRIWAGRTNGTLEFTNNTGSSWNDVGADIPNRFITDIAVSPFSNNRVMVTVGGYGQDNIWYTTNEGDDWTNVSLDFDMQINTVTWHPSKSNWVYVGTDFGIFASENNGTDWSVLPIYDENEGPYNGEISELFWAGDGSSTNPYYLFAATFGRGMWRTSTPLRDRIYVDRLYTGTSNGSFSKPYKTVADAFDAAGSGSEVIFLSSGTHPISNTIILDRKVKITLSNGGNTVLIR